MRTISPASARGSAEKMCIRDRFGNANVLGRVGGDELVVFAPQTRNETDAREKAEALIQRIACLLYTSRCV